MNVIYNYSGKKHGFDESFAEEVLKNIETVASPSLFAANFLAWTETIK